MVPAATLPPPAQGPYHIRVADVLEVAFFRTPELTQTRQVGPDGFITLSPIGSVRAAGFELDEFADRLRTLYASQLQDPEITISVAEYSDLQVYVGGSVGGPGMLPYHGGLTLVQAVLASGGFTDEARLDQVLVIRKGPEAQPVGTLVNLDEILSSADFGSDIPLAPSDIVFIPRSRIASVNLFVQQVIRNNLPIPFALGFDVVR